MKADLEGHKHNCTGAEMHAVCAALVRLALHHQDFHVGHDRTVLEQVKLEIFVLAKGHPVIDMALNKAIDEVLSEGR